MHVRGMLGLGDSVYQRPVVRRLALAHELLFIETAWPELFRDIPNCYPVRPATNLRTQGKNIARQDINHWREPPTGCPMLRLHYDTVSLAGGTSIFEGLQRSVNLPIQRGALGFPRHAHGDGVFHAPRPYILVRPIVERVEWFAPARNPDPLYLIAAVGAARAAGYAIVSVADLQPGREYIVEPAPPRADIEYHAGELGPLELASVYAGAHGAVGGVGWIVPFALATGTPTLVLQGGLGRYNSESRIVGPLLDGAEALHWARPDAYCMCTDMRHDCAKAITPDRRLSEIIDGWLKSCAESFLGPHGGDLPAKQPVMAAGSGHRVLPDRPGHAVRR